MWPSFRTILGRSLPATSKTKCLFLGTRLVMGSRALSEGAQSERPATDPKPSADAPMADRKPISSFSKLLGDTLKRPKQPKPMIKPFTSFTSKPLEFDSPVSKVAPSGPFVAFRGRTKEVVNGDITGAFRTLGQTLRVNNVAKDYRTQKFHEKPSNKRGRLARERHRRRFLSGVKRLVSLVKEQRKFS